MLVMLIYVLESFFSFELYWKIMYIINVFKKIIISIFLNTNYQIRFKMTILFITTLSLKSD